MCDKEREKERERERERERKSKEVVRGRESIAGLPLSFPCNSVMVL